MDQITLLLNECPLFHAGGTKTYGISEDALRELRAHLAPGITTLETGCGFSTLLFAMAGTNHFCITPNQSEVNVALAFCTKHSIDVSRLHFRVGRSDKMLPAMFDNGPLDVVLIDGGHGFPIPMVDFHYCAPRLRVGGSLIVDDCHMPSVRILYDFLSTEAPWERKCCVGNTAFFRKTMETNTNWDTQVLNREVRFLQSATILQRLFRKARRIAGRI